MRTAKRLGALARPARKAWSIPACAALAVNASGLFYPDGASQPVQGRHLDYHWDGERVDLYRDLSRGEVYRIV
jgi:hypothetical protein